MYYGCPCTTTPIVPPLSMVPIQLTLQLPFAKLMLGVIIAPLGVTIPLVIKA
jgi:hypothetical protein